MKTSIETEEEVMFYDTDCGGVVHNLAYLRFVEKARTKLAAELGLSLRDMSETGQFPVLIRTEIDYRKPAKLGDLLTIRGHLESLERARFWCSFEIVRQPDEQILITSRQQLALVQMPEGKPLRLPKIWVENFPDLRKKTH